MEAGTKLGQVVTATGKTNHLLSNNPKISQCGRYLPGGWWLSDADVPMCTKCAGKHVGGSRPLPDNTKPGRNGRA